MGQGGLKVLHLQHHAHKKTHPERKVFLSAD